MRVVKYDVSFAFVSQDGNVAGGTDVIRMDRNAIEFMFRAISPLNSDGWVNQLYNLRAYGSSMIVKTIEMTESGIRMLKIYKIVRV